MKNDYSLGDYNKDFETIWKKAGERLSAEKAQKLLLDAEAKYQKNPICVIYPGDVLVQLERFRNIDRNKFEQKSKPLSDGSILTMYKMGEEVYHVKLVGGYF